MFEGHLPSRVPTAFISSIIFSEEIEKSLTRDEQTKIFNCGVKIIVEKHEGRVVQKLFDILCAPKNLEYDGFMFKLDPTTTLDLIGSETFIPLKAVDGKPFHITFKAKGRNFFIVLSNTEDDGDPKKREAYTIFFEGSRTGEVYISKTSPKGHEKVKLDPKQKLVSVNYFNMGLNTDDYVYYHICYNASKNKILVDHYGPSKIYAFSQPIVVKNVKLDSDVKYFSCAVLDQSVTFSNMKIRIEKPPNPLKEDSKFKKSSLSSSSSSQSSQSQDQQSGIVQKVVNTAVTAVNFAKKILTGGDQQDPTSDMCNDGIKCKFYSVRDGPDKIAHFESKKHYCLYGKTCSNVNDADHCKLWVHKVKQDCPNGGKCPQITDPVHRWENFHLGHWDFMLLCKKGKNCPDRNIAGHDKKYYHE